MKVTLLSITQNSEKLIEQAGRVCYKSEKNTTKDSHCNFIKTALRKGHYSIIEHATASFLITGISRVCSHQLVRHRLASYSQRSQRYVKESKFEYVTPSFILDMDEANEVFDSLMEDISNTYTSLIKLGVKKEDARFILPNACTTEIVMTANFREWLNILETRLSKHAQWEIRELAENILTLLKRYAPNVFGDLK